MNTAAAFEHGTAAVPIVAPTDTIADVRTQLIGRRYDSVRDIAVCRDVELVGLLRVEDVLAAPPATLVGSLMDPDPPSVAPGTDQEIAAWKAARHGESSVALVEEDGRFAGLIPPHRLLAVLLAEHDEDMARLGGYLGTAEPAHSASQEAVRWRLWHRLPWLLVGLAGATVTARLLGAFEGILTTHVVIAFFIPAIVYMADAVGTQTETLVIRGLSVGVPVGRIAGRELLTGLLIGAIIAGMFLPLGLIIWDDPVVVSAAALALFAACGTATVVAMGVPWILFRSGLDPAFGSGPLTTGHPGSAVPAHLLQRRHRSLALTSQQGPSAGRAHDPRPW
jgi:magnesium transporter